MQLLPDLAKRILNEVKALTTEEVIIMDQAGTIIASMDEERIGFHHAGAKVVLETKQTLHITVDLTKRLSGVRPGINLPIFFKHHVIGVIGITGIPEEVEPFAEIIRKMTELIIKESHYIEKQEWESRMLEGFFYEWIYLDEIEVSFIERGEVLGISFTKEYQCVLIEIDPNSLAGELLTLQNIMEEWFDKVFRQANHDYLIPWGSNRFILIRSHDSHVSPSKLAYELTKCRDYFKTHLNLSIAVGVGKVQDGTGLSKSYQEAQKALKVGVKRNEVIYYDALLLDLILEDITEATEYEYLARVLSVLKNESELLNTLDVYLANDLSLKESAQVLHIHINTLHYRLNLIKKLTQIDPKSTEGIALFFIGLNLLDKSTS